MDQADKIEAFKALHQPGNPLVLVNAWDVGTARAVADAGASAIATASWACAVAHGFADGETLPMDLALANARRMVDAVNLPVTLDFEGGYATEPQLVARHVAMASATGIAGINLEDRRPGDQEPLPIALAAARIEAAREATQVFINARIDLFLEAEPSRHTERMEEAIARAIAYTDAGADGIFVPGLSDLELLARICAASPVPVNAFHLDPRSGVDALSRAGVGRISSGPGPYRALMTQFTDMARDVYKPA